MLLKTTSLFCTLAAILPSIAAYNFNATIGVHMLGDINPAVPDGLSAPESLGADRACGGDTGVPDGGYACGQLKDVGFTIYKCKGTTFTKAQQCKWNGGDGGQCARNSIHGGIARFYPFVGKDKVVCVDAESISGP